MIGVAMKHVQRDTITNYNHHHVVISEEGIYSDLFCTTENQEI